MTGWGRRSKKRPRRTGYVGEASTAVESSSSESTTVSIQKSAPPKERSQTDSQDEIRFSEAYPTNNDVLYHPQPTLEHREPKSINQLPPPAPESPKSPPCYPRTLVNGVYYVHDPSSLPQPLGQGYLAWASLEHEAARRLSPRRSGESRWNNRTLRYWHLSTDFSRFREYSDEEDVGSSNVDGSTEGYANEGGNTPTDDSVANQPAMAIRRNLIPQRPYTAPPHQCE